ncbi:MAG: hypothetical protein J6C89_00870 [Clostridia bacterium]|nr:hypothetical protein [Clostridia bacterium]
MFKLDAYDFEWICGDKDDPKDGCLHGRALMQTESFTVEDIATVSATALYLLRTLTEDHICGEGAQMFPCCAHFMVPDDDIQNVWIDHCDIGVDWTVLHRDGNVKIILKSGEETEVDFKIYQEEVFRFADKIEAYYNSCSPKQFDDEFKRNAYIAFWNEWHRRRNGNIKI